LPQGDLMSKKKISGSDSLFIVDAIASGNSLLRIEERTKKLRIKLKYGRELPSLTEEMADDVESEGIVIGKQFYNKFRSKIFTMRDHLANHSLGFVSRKGDGAWKLYADLVELEGYILTPASLEIFLQHFKEKKAEYDAELEKFIDAYPNIVDEKTTAIADSYMRNVMENWINSKIRGVKRFVTDNAEVAANKSMEFITSSTVVLTKQFEIATYTEGDRTTSYEIYTLSTEELRDAFDRISETIKEDLIATLPDVEMLKGEYSVEVKVGVLPNFKQLGAELEARKKARPTDQEMNPASKSVLDALGKDAQPMLDAYSMKKRAMEQVNAEFTALFKAEIALKLSDLVSDLENEDKKITKSVFNALLGKKTSKKTNNKIGLLDKIESLEIPGVSKSIAGLKTKLITMEKSFADNKEVDKSILADLKKLADGVDLVAEPNASPDKIDDVDLNSLLPPPKADDDDDDMI